MNKPFTAIYLINDFQKREELLDAANFDDLEECDEFRKVKYYLEHEEYDVPQKVINKILEYAKK